MERSSLRNRCRGQAALLITMSMPVLFGILGMVVDIGWAYWRKEAARTAAQAAAMAVIAAAGNNTPTTQASTNCPSNLDITQYWEVGCAFATQNGFTNGSHHQSVAIQVGDGSTAMPVSGYSQSKYFV